MYIYILGIINYLKFNYLINPSLILENYQIIEYIFIVQQKLEFSYDQWCDIKHLNGHKCGIELVHTFENYVMGKKKKKNRKKEKE